MPAQNPNQADVFSPAAALALPSQYAAWVAQILSSSPVAFWPLMDRDLTQIVDLSGNALVATALSLTRAVPTPLAGPFLATSFPNSIGAFGFLNDNDILDITGDVTYECWAYTNALGSSQLLLSKAFGPSGSGGYALQILASGAINVSHSYLGGGGVLTSTGLITAGTWNHLAFTRSGNNYTAYINGASSGTSSNATVFQNTTGQFLFGVLQQLGGKAAPLNGMLAGCAVYASALSAPTILANYQAGAPAFVPAESYPFLSG